MAHAAAPVTTEVPGSVLQSAGKTEQEYGFETATNRGAAGIGDKVTPTILLAEALR